jgi:hypothetical protein
MVLLHRYSTYLKIQKSELEYKFIIKATNIEMSIYAYAKILKYTPETTR